ncbi:outer membrane beta-barrel family protein [Fulvivirga sediminis]|uniref:TonB-dependent receptor family protein n=1 Tax=Fulvivirga sediminis TaxID=2803949 RepID=A0A937JWG0_9BACT|nr:outer membrane beta-barrel family protein [Fulvivirga sediminis]MBL3654518.1 TonB-dependent receptor family protein [Fulvivirga sediminis]
MTSTKTILIVLFCIQLVNICYAQQIHSIKAKVVNSDNEPMMGNAIILNVKDSSMITGTSYMDGDFEIYHLNERALLLKLQSLEFQDKYMFIEYEADTAIDLGYIVVSQEGSMLDEVVVRSSIPLFETTVEGATKVNVANTILATSTSVTEILSRSPNVLVDDGTVSVFGKGEAIIYLNGQRIQMDQLNNIQAAEIKTIEIISNPSAKYDSEGQAVINIITAGSGLEGLKGIFNQNVTVSDFAEPASTTNLSIDYRKGRLSGKGNYGLEVGAQRFILNTTRRRDEADDFFESNITTDWQRDIKNYSNYGLGLQYELSRDGYVSAAYNGMTYQYGGTESSENHMVFNNAYEQYKSTVYKDDLTRQNGLTINYLNPTDTLGSSFFVGGHYSMYGSYVNDFISEQSITSDSVNYRVLKNIVNREIPILSLKMDYTKVISNQARMVAGLKYGKVSNTSVSQFLISENDGPYLPDKQFSRDFNYDEEIYAGYINYNRKVNKQLSYAVGIRSEYTRYGLDTDELETSIDDVYFNIFPHLNATYLVSEKLSWFSSISSRINRPGYQSLNPTIIYQDAFTSIQGNPNIVPTKVYAFEMGANVSNITFKAGYTYEKDDIAGGAVQGDTPRSYILQTLNVKSRESYFVNGIIPFSNNWLWSSNSINLSYNKYTSKDELYGFMPTKPRIYLYTNNKITLFSGIKLHLLAWYRGNSQDAIYFRKHQADVTVGLEKDLLNKAVKLNLTANDIFHTNKPDGYYTLGDTFILFDRIYNTQNFRISITYNFGKLKKTNFKNKASGEEETDRL